MTNNANARPALTDRLAARLDDEFDYDPRIKDAVVAELAALCRAKKMSAAKLPEAVIISTLEDHTADLEPAEVPNDARADEEVEEILDMLHTAPKFDVHEHNKAVAERDAKEAAAKARRGAHADCDHESSKAARAKCRRARAKAAADDADA